MNWTKTIGSILFGVCISFSLNAQNDWCGSDHYLNQSLQDPADRAAYEAEQLQFDQVAQQHLHQGSRDLHIIPVVFHVIHDNGEGNISRDQLLDGIKVLNEDFRRTNGDASSTRSFFLPYATDSEIEFRIAQLDPTGVCTDGVNRINSTLTHDADNSVKSLSFWPSDMYMNVWVVESINSSGTTGIILGYAQFPGSGSWNSYGIVMRNDRLGRIGTSNEDGRTFTHEVGHCLNLRHTFQSGCGGDCASSGDRVCDTPPVDESTQGCNSGQNSCSNDQNGSSPYTSNVPDQIENYMSYDDCQNMYSEGQKARMKAALVSYTQLANLVSANNLAATGTDGNHVLCDAEFTAEYTTVCAGQPVRFDDQSYNGQTIWNWEFPGGFPATSNVEEPLVMYYTPGIYDVKLTVGNGNSTTSESKTAFIRVLPTPGQYLPYQEGFEGNSIADGDWVISNPDGGITWAQSNAAAATGIYSVKLDNYSNSQLGDKDEFLSSSFDLSTMTSADLEFKIAYATRTGSEDDKLWLSVSTDCGENWQLRWASSGAAMATSTPHGNTFTPSSSEWNTITVSLPAAFLEEDFRFRFEFENDGGNNLFLDDINITGTFNPVPVLVYPPDLSPSEGTNVTLDWKAVNGAGSYNYELDTDPNFSSPNLVTGSLNALGSDPSNTDTEIPMTGLNPGQVYYWRVRSVMSGAPFSWSDTWEFTVSSNGVGFDELTEQALGLGVFPNPTQDESVVQFKLNETQAVRLVLVDLVGRQVAVPESGTNLPSGQHQYSVNVADLPDGVYLLQLTVGEQSFHRKLVVH